MGEHMIENDVALRITFILPVINETYSLTETVETIFEVSGRDVHEIIIVVANRTTQESLSIADELINRYPHYIRVHKQTLPFLGGAIREAFSCATGDYIMLMSSDLETDPSLIPLFVRAMKAGNCDIVAGSRWIKGGGFEGYSKVKLFLNYLFQKIFRIVYKTNLTDLTFAYRLYRRSILTGMVWEELKHPFLLECLVKPIRGGAHIKEVPCVWRARSEAVSSNTLLDTFKYLKIAVTSRFISKTNLYTSYKRG
jgi:glycosyltransferase involved in cell wall biosynthesis